VCPVPLGVTGHTRTRRRRPRATCACAGPASRSVVPTEIGPCTDRSGRARPISAQRTARGRPGGDAGRRECTRACHSGALPVRGARPRGAGGALALDALAAVPVPHALRVAGALDVVDRQVEHLGQVVRGAGVGDASAGPLPVGRDEHERGLGDVGLGLEVRLDADPGARELTEVLGGLLAGSATGRRRAVGRGGRGGLAAAGEQAHAGRVTGRTDPGLGVHPRDRARALGPDMG
jgi:hypothetical protein